MEKWLYETKNIIDKASNCKDLQEIKETLIWCIKNEILLKKEEFELIK